MTDTTPTTEDTIIICPGVIEILRAAAAGIINNEVIRSTPTILIAIAMTAAINNRNIISTVCALMPSASANSRLTVTANRERQMMAKTAPGLRLFESREVGVLNPLSSNGHTHDHAHHDHETQDDLHLWLDPENGIVMAAHLAEIFAILDPAGADLYQANFQQFRKQMTLQIKRLKKPYVVFHDAYQYFEKRFDLKASGVLTLNPEMAASAKVVQELRVYIQQHNVRCVFREPQFSSAILESLVEGLDVEIGIFDPLGASGVRGVALYPQIIEGMADAFEQCVSRD